MSQKSPRIAIAGLALSAVAFVGLAVKEGYTDRAIQPVKNDKWTLGFGMTERPDGSPVRPGDTTNPVDSLKRSLAWLQKGEAEFKKCVKAPLQQVEYDLYVAHMYNIGTTAFCNSTMVRKINAQDYTGACQQFLQWRFYQGFDCSTPGNKKCYGLWTRRLESYTQCMGAQ